MEGLSLTPRFPCEPEPGPVVVSAVWNAGPRNVVIAFNMNLQPAVLDLTNWSLTHSGGSATPGSAAISGAVITLGFMAFTGVTAIKYLPPPFDVIGVNTRPADAFTEPL